jgi:hypothetical protein
MKTLLQLKKPFMVHLMLAQYCINAERSIHKT